MNREDVLQQLEPLTRVNVRQVQEAARSRVVVTPEMITLRPGSGGQLIPLNDQGAKALVNFAGVPAKLGQELLPDTFSRVLSELLRRKGSYNILMTDGEAVNFAEYRGFRTISPERVLTTIERTIKKVEYHRVLNTSDYSATIEVVGEKRQAVVRGDLVRAGAMVSFSPIGTILPSVQSYVVRLSCTNGQTSMFVLREFRGGGNGDGDGNIWEWFRNSIRDAYAALDPIIERYRAMRQERVPAENRAGMIEALLRQSHITGEDADAVRAEALTNPPRNTYDLLNLITWASSHVIRQPARIASAQHTAAQFASDQEHARVCPVCHSRR